MGGYGGEETAAEEAELVCFGGDDRCCGLRLGALVLRLYRDGVLLSASRVTVETLPRILLQNILVNGPEMLAVTVGLVWMGRERFAQEMGLTIPGKKRFALLTALVLCLLPLALALLFSGSEPLAIGYQWGYYLLIIAFTEELMFRGLLPYLMEKSGLSGWAVWIIPGVLFACMHTLMPMIQNGFTVRGLVFRLLSVLGGYTAGHCGFYALRRWSGTLWLPVLIHGLLDFSSVFIT